MNNPEKQQEAAKRQQARREAQRLDQQRISRFKRALDAGTAFEDLPEDLRRWWRNRY